MSLTKLYSRKLVTRIVCVLLGIYSFLPAYSSDSVYYAVQLAASKKPLDIRKFASRYQIKESIKEIVAEDWNRYITGKFENLRKASLYASEIESKTGIKGILVTGYGAYGENASSELLQKFNMLNK